MGGPRRRSATLMQISAMPGAGSHAYWSVPNAGRAEHFTVGDDLIGGAGRLVVVVAQLDRGVAVHALDLADQRDGPEWIRSVRMAADEIVGEVGPPAEADLYPAAEMPLDAGDVGAVRLAARQRHV